MYQDVVDSAQLGGRCDLETGVSIRAPLRYIWSCTSVAHLFADKGHAGSVVNPQSIEGILRLF